MLLLPTTYYYCFSYYCFSYYCFSYYCFSYMLLLPTTYYYCFSYLDFDQSKQIKYEDVPHLCDKFNIKKNLINPTYIS